MKLPEPEPDTPKLTPEDRQKLAVFLADESLYSKLSLQGNLFSGDTLEHVAPLEIARVCSSDKCNGLRLSWARAAQPPIIHQGMYAGLVYKCRNCGSPFHIWIRWLFLPSYAEAPSLARALQSGDVGVIPNLTAGTFHFEKVGQAPAGSTEVPPDLAQALGGHAILYRRGLISRNLGHGIGAHAYFRRVVEETMDEMLTLLVAALKEDGADTEIIKRLEAAKGGHVFERKAKIAADALPERLRPGGINPFGSLHALHSDNLHGKSDEECVQAVDQMRNDLDIIFKMLKAHVSDRAGYKEAAKRLQQQNDPGQKGRV